MDTILTPALPSWSCSKVPPSTKTANSVESMYTHTVSVVLLLAGSITLVRAAISAPLIDQSRSTASTISGSLISCTGSRACYNHTVQCDDSVSCDVLCIGRNSCKFANIICPRNPSADCNILCTGGDDPCEDSQIDASQSKSLHFVGRTDPASSGQNSALQRGVVMCPQATSANTNPLCNITGIGHRPFRYFKVNAVNTGKLIINTYDGTESLATTDIFCPRISSSNDPLTTNCSITFTDHDGANSAFYQLNVYQPNGLNGVYLRCDALQQSDCFLSDSNWSTDDQPQIFCGDDYSSNCYLSIIDDDPAVYPDGFICSPFLGINDSKCGVTDTPNSSDTPDPNNIVLYILVAASSLCFLVVCVGISCAIYSRKKAKSQEDVNANVNVQPSAEHIQPSVQHVQQENVAGGEQDAVGFTEEGPAGENNEEIEMQRSVEGNAADAEESGSRSSVLYERDDGEMQEMHADITAGNTTAGGDVSSFGTTHA